MRVLVLGAGVSGKAAARLLRSLGHEALIFDQNPMALAELREMEFEVHNGEWTRRRLSRVDLVVVSPGFRPDHPALADAVAAGAPVIGELELAARHLDIPIVAVTGTNGKTTVTELIARMLNESGMGAVAAGNIGTALSDVAAAGGAGASVAVVETSSFQLHFIEGFHAQVAVVLNIAPDHLDWHGTWEAYVADKARILDNQGRDDLFVYTADDAGAAGLAGAARGRTIPVSGTWRLPNGVGPEGDELWLGSVAVPVPEWMIGDAVHLSNVAAAGVTALDMGGRGDGIAAAVAGFRPGRHRREEVASWDGVTWIDDSKATNPHAAVAAAGSYPSVVLIAGGRNKGLDLAPLAEVETVRHFVLIGEAAAELAALLPGDKVSRAGSIGDAVAAAGGAARPGDTVLLAPGCASFDMFTDYQHRGDAFAAAVRARREECR